MNRTTDRKNIYKEITDKIIDSLQAGVIPWVRPWDAVKYGEHRNGVTNRPYRGLNVMLLNLVAMMKGFADPRWLTYRNAAKLGGHVRKGESGVSILFWKFVAEKERDEEEDRLIPIARMYTVFNVEQCQGLDLPELAAKDCNEEGVNQVAYLVMGHDLTVTICAEGGQLQLNAFEPTIGYCLLSSLRHLTAAVTTLTTRCVNGIEADRERCRALVEDSIGLVTALGPTLGYEASSRVAKRALREKRKVAEIVLEENLLTPSQLDELLRIEAMTGPGRQRFTTAAK